MEQFYQQVFRRLREQMARDRASCTPNSTEADVLRALIGAETWREAFQISVEQTPEQAVSYLREQVKSAVKKFLRAAAPRRAAAAAPAARPADRGGRARHAAPGRPSTRTTWTSFRGKLAGLLPANFTPQGSGPMKVLITYPADAREPGRRGLPEGRRSTCPAARGSPRTSGTPTTESISVVLFRTAMGVTEVDEVRDVLRLWASALADREPTDLLRWRQRTGYDFGYLATREQHRVEILHRILCALWNGKATISGPETSPGAAQRHARRRRDHDAAAHPAWQGVLLGQPAARLRAVGAGRRRYAPRSSARSSCGRLPRASAAGGVDAGSPVPVVRDLAEGQIELLDDMMKKQAASQQSRARPDARVLGSHPARARSTRISCSWTRPSRRACGRLRGSWTSGPPDDGRAPVAVGLSAAEARQAADAMLDIDSRPGPAGSAAGT